MIVLEHLRKEYGNVVPIEDVNVTINDGDVISIIGPSGTGKSTLVRCLNLLEKPTSGHIWINGTDITAKNCKIQDVRKKIGMVFQSFNLYGHKTVVENVMEGPVNLLGVDRKKAYDDAMSLLKMVGMERQALKYPDTISGGQKQRVAIARALSMNPEIILFDEPTSALDPTMVGEVESVIKELTKMGKTMLIVTHELRFAKEISNRVFYLDQGGIYEDGTPEQIFVNPQKELTRRFIHRLKILEITITGKNSNFLGFLTEFSVFFYKNDIHGKIRYRIESIFEEMCEQIIMPELVNPRIRFVVEYEDSSGQAIITISYNGKPFDPRTSSNEISLSIIKSNIRQMDYVSVEEGFYTNKVVIRT